MKTVLLHPNEGRDLNLIVSKRIQAFLTEKGIRVCVPEGKRLDGAQELSQDHLSEADLCIVLGGDGSMIRAAHLMLSTGVPMVGINLGHLGFMSELDEENAEEGLSAILNGKGNLEKRMMLHAEIMKANGSVASFESLNDLVMRRSDFSGAIRFEVDINGEKVDTMRGDGVILSTPNGSTGYNLSAGGPLISPDAENIILTPLCNHSILERSLVLGPKDSVSLKVEKSEYQDAPLFCCDNLQYERLDHDCIIRVSRSQLVFPLMRVRQEHFFRFFVGK